MIEAIIFDFYGVLYSNFDWEAIDERIYSDAQKKNEFREYIRQANLGKMTNEELVRHASRLASDKLHPEKPVINPSPSLNLVALGIIEDVKSKYRIGLLSNGGREHINLVFEDVGGVEKYFDVVVTSTDSHFMKPDRRSFKAMTDRLAVQPGRTLMIDDSPKHFEGAIKSGLKSIMFNDMKQLRDDLTKLGVLNA